LAGSNYFILDEGRWSAASYEVHRLINNRWYQFDRAAESMLVSISILVILGALLVYSVEGIQFRRREIALLRALGANRHLVSVTQATELLVMFLLSSIFLLLYSPIMIWNSLFIMSRTYSPNFAAFPLQLYVIIPWLSMISFVIIFFIWIIVFIFVISILGTRFSIADALNSSWTISGPMGGES